MQYPTDLLDPELWVPSMINIDHPATVQFLDTLKSYIGHYTGCVRYKDYVASLGQIRRSHYKDSTVIYIPVHMDAIPTYVTSKLPIRRCTVEVKLVISSLGLYVKYIKDATIDEIDTDRYGVKRVPLDVSRRKRWLTFIKKRLLYYFDDVRDYRETCMIREHTKNRAISKLYPRRHEHV